MLDIDIDCLPEARDKVKAFAAERYGREYVCSVGTWLTYKFKLALQDAARGLGIDPRDAMNITKNLPDTVDDLKDGGYAACSACGHKHKMAECPKCGGVDTESMTLGKLFDEHPELKAYSDANPLVVDYAVRLVGKIRSMGKHAGGVIITNRKLMGNVPMALSKGSGGQKQWTSMWTEGRNTQLSKLGYVKWDMLGLKTLQYIHEACKLIDKTRGVKFNNIPWEGNDPEQNCVGWYTDESGKNCKVRMDDEKVFTMINELKLETVFQFETDVQRGVLSNGVRDYYDLQVFNAMGHPGPIAFIPEYVKRRDDKDKNWKKNEHPDIAAELEATHGIIVYQEQLAKIWRKFGGFTAPESEAARKAVAKKWTEKLKPIKHKWVIGASKRIGAKWAEEMWTRMETFGRYAFNASHSCAYILVAYWCAWLKAHYPPEWWSAVMSGCKRDRIPKYMNTARLEGVKFGPIQADALSDSFTVSKDLRVTPGLTSIRGIGAKAAAKLRYDSDYDSLDDFVKTNGKSKLVMQPLIKLGAFGKWHPNARAAWMWYQYKYCTGKDITKLRADIRDRLVAKWAGNLPGDGSVDDKINDERARQREWFKHEHPKRKIPNKILNWKPKPSDSRAEVMVLYPDDFKLEELLLFEKEYLGYYWHSPLDIYKTSGLTIKLVKDSVGGRGRIECVVESLTVGQTRRGSKMGRLRVTDGLSSSTIILWAAQLGALKPFMNENFGIRVDVKYDSSRNSFTLAKKDTVPIPLDRRDV